MIAFDKEGAKLNYLVGKWIGEFFRWDFEAKSEDGANGSFFDIFKINNIF